jgi:ketosteroid isomerase-like protein
MRSPRETALALWTRWAEDPAGSMKNCAPDIVYTLNVSPQALQLGGETVGWEAVNARMCGIREVFDYLVYIPRIMAVEGNMVRANIEIILRHRPSGELLSGNIRNVLTARDGMVARVDEYVDAPLIETFMRLFADRGETEAAGDSVSALDKS